MNPRAQAVSSEPRKRLLDAIAEYYQGEWGFTGTRSGMTEFQLSMTTRVFKLGKPTLLRIGGAYGADTEAFGALRSLSKTTPVEVWPADPKRAMLFKDRAHTEVMAVMPPLDRNIEIVIRSKFLLATPHSEVEMQRSGTWHTIRQALQRNMPVLIIWPFTKRITFHFERKLHRVTYTG